MTTCGWVCLRSAPANPIADQSHARWPAARNALNSSVELSQPHLLRVVERFDNPPRGGGDPTVEQVLGRSQITCESKVAHHPPTYASIPIVRLVGPPFTTCLAQRSDTGSPVLPWQFR